MFQMQNGGDIKGAEDTDKFSGSRTVTSWIKPMFRFLRSGCYG